jgi:peroxiredoxin Q/BCP
MNRFIVLMAVLVMAVGSGVASGQELGPGDPAPPFELPGSDGKNHSLADYAGRTVVLAWFPKAFTGG